jgi:polyphenol oxidase
VPAGDPDLGGFAAEMTLGARGQIRIGYTNVRSGSFDLATVTQTAREAITGLSQVSWLRQEHGTKVWSITDKNPKPVCGEPGDALVTNQPNHALSILTADCAPIALWTNNGFVGAVHAGWKGLEAGIIEVTIDTIRRESGQFEVFGWLGPCIGAKCYEFGEPELTRLADRYGPTVRSTTAHGSPSLDLAAGVQAAMVNVGAIWTGSAQACTACDEQWFSWRARRSSGRQALFVWFDSVGTSRGKPRAD